MSIKLTDTQLVMLSAAAQREDHLLVAPERLKGAPLQKLANKLISAGLAKETKAKSNDPICRRDEESGASYALKLTPAEAKAIGIDEGAEPESAPSKDRALETRDQAAVSAKVEATDAPEPMEPIPAGPSTPRGGSKLAQVIELLQRDHGATLEELIGATGWLAHTTRAALTGLRKRGYMVAIDRSDNERGSFYRIKAEGGGEPVARPSEEPADAPTSRKPVQRFSKPQGASSSLMTKRRQSCGVGEGFTRASMIRSLIRRPGIGSRLCSQSTPSAQRGRDRTRVHSSPTSSSTIAATG
jgi:hypothetical protein